MEVGKRSEVKGLIIVSLRPPRGMEPQSANVSVVSLADSPMVELDTNISLGKPLFLIHFFIGYQVIFKLNFSCRLLFWEKDTTKLIQNFPCHCLSHDQCEFG